MEATAASAGTTAATAIPPAQPAARKYNRAIIEGPLTPAVWHLAWPTILQNMIAGLQGMIDHIMVGHFVGYAGNAAIGVSWQIFLVVVVFISSLFSGMSVLVARFVGAGNSEMADRTIYQAFITAAALAIGILAPIGYMLAPTLLNLINAAPSVQHQALPYLRIMFMYSFGMLIFFMVGGALRSAGDARTPLRLGAAMTALNIVLNVIFIRGLGPIPAYGTAGAAMGTVIAAGLVAIYSIYKLYTGGWVAAFPRGGSYRPDMTIIRSLFRFGLPTGIQGIAMNVGGVLMLSYIGSLAQSAAAQAAFAVSYTQLFSLITWTSVGLMGAAAAVAGQNLGAGSPERAIEGVHVAARIGISVAFVVGILFIAIPQKLLAVFGLHNGDVVALGTTLLRVLSLSGLFITIALTYTGGLQGTGDTKSPLYISVVSQVIIPLSICFIFQRMGRLQPIDIWLAILAGHATRATLSMIRFRQGHWRNIKVLIS
jgi:putative MATE family efflux protein